MKDHIARAVTTDGFIRADAITSRHMTERARQIHRCLPPATAALGRTLAAASMMGAQLKDIRHSVTVQIHGDGPLGSICAVSDGEGNVRGYLTNPGIELPLREDGKIDVGRGVGLGRMTVIRDMGLKEPYIGMVELKSGEIAEDFTEYFYKSEQIRPPARLASLWMWISRYAPQAAISCSCCRSGRRSCGAGWKKPYASWADYIAA